MPLDLRIELRGFERAAGEIALELGHVDAIGRKPAEALVERRRNVAHFEQEGRFRRAIACVNVRRCARHDHEARRVVRGVLDILGEDFQSVDLRREARRDGGDRRIAQLRHFAGRAGGIGGRHRLDSMLAQEVAALAETHDVRARFPDIRQLRAFQGHQLEADRQVILAGDVELGGGQQIVNVADPARDRVLDRDHGEGGFALLDGDETVLEGAAGHGLMGRKGLAAGNVRVRARFALIGNFLAHCGNPCPAPRIRRASDRRDARGKRLCEAPVILCAPG